jgi:hypothetical protein
MAGWKMAAARRTLQLCLRSLPAGCLFNIISFGSSFSMMFPDGSQEYGEDTLTGRAHATHHTQSNAWMASCCLHPSPLVAQGGRAGRGGGSYARLLTCVSGGSEPNPTDVSTHCSSH